MPDNQPSPGATDPQIQTVTLDVCEYCLAGAGGECHSPGCSFWLNRAPDLPLTLHVEAEGIIRVDTRDEATIDLVARATTHVNNPAIRYTIARAVLAALHAQAGAP